MPAGRDLHCLSQASEGPDRGEGPEVEGQGPGVWRRERLGQQLADAEPRGEVLISYSENGEETVYDVLAWIHHAEGAEL